MAHIKTKEEIKQAEADFQTELKIYRETSSKGSWDKMFLLVQDCCTNIIKKRLKGVRCPDFEGKALDATMDVMKKILDGTDPQKLSSFCYLYTLWPLYNKRTKFFERQVSLDEYLENNAEKEFENEAWNMG